MLNGILSSPQRLALTMGLEPKFNDREFVMAWRERVKTLKPIPPEFLKEGPILENVDTGNETFGNFLFLTSFRGVRDPHKLLLLNKYGRSNTAGGYFHQPSKIIL